MWIKKSDNIKLLVFIHSVCPYKNDSMECSQKLQTLYKLANQSELKLTYFLYIVNGQWSKLVVVLDDIKID